MTGASRARLGRSVLTVVLVATIASQIVFVWLGATGQHVFNAEWHPHARFHIAQQSFTVTAVTLGGLWLLWRRCLEPRLAVAIVAAVTVIYWASEFLALAVPGTSPSPVLTAPNTFRLFGAEVYGNLFFSAVLIVLSLLGALLACASSESRPAGTVRTAANL